MAAARYLGTTGRHLAGMSRADRLRAVLDPRALFPRRGALSLFDNRLVLAGWEHAASVTVHAREVDAIGISSPIVGPRRAEVRPLVLHQHNGEALYLMINHRWLPSRDDNAQWAVLFTNWLDEFG